MRELIKRSSDTESSLLVADEMGLAGRVKELWPEVRYCAIEVNGEGIFGVRVKGVLFLGGKFYDIEDYAKLLNRLDNEAIERGEYKRWTREGVVGVQKIIRQIAQKIVEDFKAGRLKEWADSRIMYEKSPLIA